MEWLERLFGGDLTLVTVAAGGILIAYWPEVAGLIGKLLKRRPVDNDNGPEPTSEDHLDVDALYRLEARAKRQGCERLQAAVDAVKAAFFCGPDPVEE